MDLPDDQVNQVGTVNPVNQGIGGVSKERIVTEKTGETEFRETLVEPEIITKDVEHLEAIGGAEMTLTQAVTDDSTGQPILDNAAPQQVTITLPLTDDQLNVALHVKLINSIRWLAEWMKRVVQIIGGKFTYKTN